MKYNTIKLLILTTLSFGTVQQASAMQHHWAFPPVQVAPAAPFSAKSLLTKQNCLVGLAVGIGIYGLSRFKKWSKTDRQVREGAYLFVRDDWMRSPATTSLNIPNKEWTERIFSTTGYDNVPELPILTTRTLDDDQVTKTIHHGSFAITRKNVQGKVVHAVLAMTIEEGLFFKTYRFTLSALNKTLHGTATQAEVNRTENQFNISTTAIVPIEENGPAAQQPGAQQQQPRNPEPGADRNNNTDEE